MEKWLLVLVFTLVGYSGATVSQDHGVVNKDYYLKVQKAANQGDTDAQSILGYMYLAGEGVPRDYAQAASWYRKAADQGQAGAQNNLGLIYYNGEGVPRDYKLAYFWWLLSSAQGVEEAAKSRDTIENIPTPQQRAETQAAATNWKPIVPAQ